MAEYHPDSLKQDLKCEQECLFLFLTAKNSSKNVNTQTEDNINIHNL